MNPRCGCYTELFLFRYLSYLSYLSKKVNAITQITLIYSQCLGQIPRKISVEATYKAFLVGRFEIIDQR